MKFAMYQIMGIENQHCSFCLKKKKEIEYLDAHNDEGTIVFAFQVCKDCAKDIKESVNNLFEEK